MFVNTDHDLEGIYKTTDGGASWSAIPTSSSTGLSTNALGGFGWYFGQIRIDPSNDDRLYLLGVGLWYTLSGGNSWSLVSTTGTVLPHVDNHDLVFNTSKDVFLGTDGGVYRRDFGQTNWMDIETTPTTQFYRTGYNPHQTDTYYGGAQDNGSLEGGTVAGLDNWDRIFGGDGFQPAFHPTNSNISYVETQRGIIWRSDNGGTSYLNATSGLESADRRGWDMPYIMSPHNPNVLYTGTYRAYRSESAGFTELAND